MSAAIGKMHYDDGLTDAERDAVIDDMHKIYSMVLTDVVNQLIALADKHKILCLSSTTFHARTSTEELLLICILRTV